jgi:hypothetical protein
MTVTCGTRDGGDICDEYNSQGPCVHCRMRPLSSAAAASSVWEELDLGNSATETKHKKGSWLLLGTCSVRVTGRYTNFNEIFRDFPPCLHANAGILHQLGNDCFLPHTFQFIDQERR